MKRGYKIAVFGGDGIGPEVIREGKKVLEAVSEHENFELRWIDYPNGGEYYLRTGELLSEETLKELEQCDAIYFGSIGDPRVEPGILERGILLTLRFFFDQYVNLRPVKLLEGVPSPLAHHEHDIDFTVVRENTEDFYVSIGGRVKGNKSSKELKLVRNLYNIKFKLDIESDADELAYQIGVITREGCERVMRFAFELARKTGKKRVTSVDKANVLTEGYGFWREVFNEVAREYPDIETEFNYVDAMCMWLVKNPEWYKVVVAPNMFGDIITDLGAMIQGGLGLAPGANINPDGVSMFEPIHGSAPKYSGKGVSNPIAAIWAGAMLLENIGESRASEIVLHAIEAVLRDGKVRTYDLGGKSKTSEVGDAIVSAIKTI
ncbi:MAG: isocitrate/isopropylmalate dehydrogenase family protein [Methanophagales archaeon]|nr:isocitrate/isopropylmalate dehydrogenase family protein [Methanophagales archaeon]MCW3139381.1 isocitrate/isopropylmalate dehydrogenase family protein [Methanophagales archaeon]MCW7070313.1 isocitrate/isopropylmalate dehydrogenase family protein [Methanophagales archaeon]MCW7073499.1 isocitrate/isopropylmalate dehydrogenase family protein [Methanophagales archaeon]